MNDSKKGYKNYQWVELPLGRVSESCEYIENRGYIKEPIEHVEVVTSHKLPGYWLLRTHGKESEVVGPFRKQHILRAYNLLKVDFFRGCTCAPECEWVDAWEGGSYFNWQKASGGLVDWQFFDNYYLPPSITRYTRSDVLRDPFLTEGKYIDYCGSFNVPSFGPSIVWHSNEELLLVLQAFESYVSDNLFLFCGCISSCLWNGHPVGSIVSSDSEDLVGGFIVVDLPEYLEDILKGSFL